MANVNRPNGANPVRSIHSPWPGQASLYWIPSTDATYQYNPGDFVVSTAGSSTGSLGFPPGIPQISKAAGNASTTCRGIIAAIGYNPNNLTAQSAPVTKTQDYYAYVVDDPDVIFEMTDDGLVTANLVASAVGKNCDFTVANPTAPAVQSATVIKSSTIADTSTLPLKIVGIALYPGNTAGAYCRWLVKFNTHELSVAATSGT